MNKKTYESIRKSFSMTDLERAFLSMLGWYYHNLYAPHTQEAIHAIKNLGIHKVVIKDKDIFLCLERPGLFIGTKGSNIEAIEKEMKKEDEFKDFNRINVVEVIPPMDYLASWTYTYCDIDEL